MNTKYFFTILGIGFLSLALGFSTAIAGGDANESDYHSEFFANDVQCFCFNRGEKMTSTDGDWERSAMDIDLDYHTGLFDSEGEESLIETRTGRTVASVEDEDWNRTELSIDGDYHSGFFENEEGNNIILKVGKDVVVSNDEIELNRDSLDIDSDYHTGFFENEVGEENGKIILCFNCEHMK